MSSEFKLADLASEMMDDIRARMENSKALFAGDKSPLGVLIEGATEQQKLLFVLALPLANLFDFLL